ncbi:MAG: molybdate ABC transporter permease subunit, partial [Betaproteobacteria bacterium]|nr:molybdate ABC transporter permease subunit [Betaproteobacteria bacterium]
QAHLLSAVMLLFSFLVLLALGQLKSRHDKVLT